MTPPSRILSFARDEDAFIRDFTAFVAGFDLQTAEAGDDVVLKIPGYRDIPWRKPRRDRVLGQKKSNLVFYEEGATAAITYFFDHLDVANLYDVGASYPGYFSRLALYYKRKPIHVLAFEMQPELHQRFAADLETLDVDRSRIELMLSGLTSHHVGQKEIWYSRSHLFETKPDPSQYRKGFWIRLKNTLRGDPDRDVLRHAEIELTSIDHFSAARRLTPDIVKIDVEGYEAEVLPGGMAVFAEHRPIILLELHRQKRLDRFGTTRRGVLKPLFDLGYKALMLHSHLNTAASIVPIGPESQIVDEDRTNMVVFY